MKEDEEDEYEGIRLRDHLQCVATFFEVRGFPEEFKRSFPRTTRLLKRGPLHAKPDSQETTEISGASDE